VLFSNIPEQKLRKSAVSGEQVCNVAADQGDARSELLAREDILQFGDERGAGEEGQALLTGCGEYSAPAICS
jgi:hypothetical protein